MKTLAAFAAVIAAAAPAYALNQSKHYEIANNSCLNAGLPSTFCQRVAAETYDVDAYEFDDLSAHSQIPVGQTACDAANAVMAREAGLGAEIRYATEGVAASPSRGNAGGLAQALGRALHTVQDNCAHSGMGNPQHAWHSLSDVCRGTSESPDVAPEAATCAAVETDAVIAAVVDLLHDLGGELSNVRDVDDGEKHFPSYHDVCDFLGSASTWDGSDRRWDNDVVRPAIRAQLVEAIQNDQAETHDACAGATDGILVSWQEDVDVSVGTPSCLKIHAFCLGKADSLEGAEPPYEALEPAATVHAGGCAVAYGDGLDYDLALPSLLLVACAALLARGLNRRPRA